MVVNKIQIRKIPQTSLEHIVGCNLYNEKNNIHSFFFVGSAHNFWGPLERAGELNQKSPYSLDTR